MRKAIPLAVALLMLVIGTCQAATTYNVEPVTITDDKAVFATVESLNVVPARVRTGGTIATLSVKQGDWVEADQILATVGDPKLILQGSSLDAQIEALSAQLAQARSDLARAQSLFQTGSTTKTNLDIATTAVNVAQNNLKARTAERAVIAQQLAEGNVLAPTAGRVLTVPVTAGNVVMSGETVATVAEQNFVLRLEVPESYARSVKAGDAVRIDAADLAQGAARSGSIMLVYPQIEGGRIVADAQVSGLGNYFVGERVLVWISAGERKTFVVPERYIATRFGLDYAHVRRSDGTVVEIPVQRGQPRPRPDMPDGLEILSGLQTDDVLVQP